MVTVAATAGIVSLVKAKNIGWYSWSESVQRTNLNTMLEEAFSAAKEAADKPASDYFWTEMDAYNAKDKSLEQFLGRKANSWVTEVIEQYEDKYGFGFYEVYEKKLWDNLWFKALVAVAAAVCVYLIAERIKG